MKIRELTSFLESFAPLSYQEKYDNSGLIVGDVDRDITGVLICLDSTEAVIREAIEKGCNLVIAHHPIIFTGLKKLTGQTYIGRTIIRAIKHDIAIYAMHTNLDNLLEGGVSERIAKRIGLRNLEILDPKPGFLARGENVGTGIVGYTENPVDEASFLQWVKDRMAANVVRHTRLLGKPVQKVAVCGGACSFLLKTALHQGADVFITADFKYHEFFDADDRMVIADIGHYESEQFTIELIHEIITKNFSTFAAHLTKVVTNPINYL
jgi:dinuclear metal center YbgI/SA1388 family protein